MDHASFTCLIVAYNSAGEIASLLDDLRLYMPGCRIIVIDNASKDGTKELIQRSFPQVVLIQNIVNVGYSRAVNQGIDLCETDHVLLLNPDIRILSPDLFAALARCLRASDRVAAAAPLQFKNDHDRRYLNFTWSYSSWAALRAYIACAWWGRQIVSRAIRVPFLNAGCLLLSKSAFEQVGRLNEKYFLYGEEPDLFLKFRRYGFESYLLPNVAVIHERERSLMTVSRLQRLSIRLHAAWNILDALANGWAHIVLDRLAVRHPQHWTGNGHSKLPG